MSKKMYPIKKKNRFYYNECHEPESLLLTTLPSFCRSFFGRKKRLSTASNDWLVTEIPVQTSISPIITWIGHASFLVQIGGLNILLDPVFQHVSWLYPRILPPGISIEQMPPIHAVLLSHNHFDHMDYASLTAMEKYKPNFLVPHGDKALLDSWKFSHVYEFMWWQSQSFTTQSGTVTITFLPSHHWSRRGIFDLNTSLWGSWLIQCGNDTIYFAGDTGYETHFKQIVEECGPIDIALMPVGPCEPNTSMRRTHIDAHQAGTAFLDLQATHFIPMHWGTFAFGTDHFLLPIERLQAWWQTNQQQVRNKHLHILKIGQRLVF